MQRRYAVLAMIFLIAGYLAARQASLLRQVAETLAAFGIEVDAMHHEMAPGQLELDLHYSNALQTADSVVTLRLAVKAVAQDRCQSGRIASQSTGFRSNSRLRLSARAWQAAADRPAGPPTGWRR